MKTQSRRLLGGGAIGLWGVLALTLCASLLFAAPASAKVTEYSAKLNLPSGEYNGLVEFKVKSKKNKQTKKFRPVALKRVSVYTTAECSNGSGVGGDFPASLSPFPSLIPLSGRSFSRADTDKGQEIGGPVEVTLNLSGRIPRNGPPTGTLRYTTTYPDLVGEDPNSPASYAQVSCDSGPMSWTAKSLEGVY